MPHEQRSESKPRPCALHQDQQAMPRDFSETKLLDRMIVPPGRKIKLAKDFSTSWKEGPRFRQASRRRASSRRRPALVGVPKQALRAESVRPAGRLAGHGCGGQRWHHQARHVRSQPAGLPRHQLQIAVGRRARPRLSLAPLQSPPGTRPHRHFQSLLLRGSARRALASGVSGEAAAAALGQGP